jgi:hypothetical protein
MNRTHWTAALCLGLATLLGGGRLAAADSEPMDQLKTKMKKEGWREVTEGVFERQLGPTKVERLGYGREGLEWTIGELSRKLENLQKEQELYPSAKLAKTIDELTGQVGKFRRQIWNLDIDLEKGLSNVVEAVTGPSCSSICYSATADAYPLTASQGVAAVAHASFSSSCGYSGDTYAYAYSRATLGTTTTTITQSDPDSGTSVTSSASATSNGGSVAGIPCASDASAYVVSTALGISYSTSDTNSSCTAPSCSATISGTSYELFTSFGCRSRTWSVSLTGGCTASSYQWKVNGSVVGSGSTYTRNVCPGDNPGFTLEATVNGSYTASRFVTVDYQICECNCGGGNNFPCN